MRAIKILLSYKTTEFTKNNGDISPIVYRIDWSWTKGHATLYFAFTYK